MSEHADREVVDHPDWKLTPRAWSDNVACGFALSGTDSRPPALRFVDGADTVTVTWWEEARLYYRSVK